MRVVCVVESTKNLGKVLPPVVGEIYTVKDEMKEFKLISGCGYVLFEIPDCVFDKSLFRPISDCGESICEWIEETHFKEFEYQEALKQEA